MSGIPAEKPKWLQSIMDHMDQRLNEITKTVSHTDANLEKLNLSVLNILKKNEEQDERIQIVEKENFHLGKEVKLLRRKISELECQNKKNNLILNGVKEDEKEDIIKKVKEILSQTMKIDITNMVLDKTYRKGKPNNSNPRPIVIEFQNYKDREVVWRKKANLRGSSFILNEDFPIEITQNRKTLWPIFMAAKDTPEITSANLHLDSLYINNKLYTVDNLNDLPECLKPHRRCHQTTDDVFLFYTKDSIFSNFYPMVVKIDGNNYNCNEQYYQWAKANFFNDEDSANKILSIDDPAQMANIGRSIKGFDKSAWSKRSDIILRKVNTMKFSQNEEAKTALLNTGNRVIGEASLSREFGIGARLFSKGVTNMNWLGKNLMGNILKDIRENYLNNQ